MDSHYHIQMKGYITEIENLQSKMKELEKIKEEEESKKLHLQKETEPNFQVISTWLEEYQKRSEQKRIQDSIRNKYTQYKKGSSMYTPEETKILQAPLLKMPEMFHCTVSSSNLVPSRFMREYIEATYNLLKIQEQRIEMLESKIQELS